MSDGLRIGITFWYGSGYTDIWQNGAGQNLYFLYQVLKVQPNVREVYFVHWLSEKTIPEGLEVDSMGVPIRNLWDVLDTTDIVIEANLRVMSDAAELMRQHGILICSYKMGPAIVEDMDAFCNSIDRIGAFSDTYYDGVWLIPQFMKNTHDYLEIIMQTRVQEAPHLWTPFFFDLEAKREGIMDTVFYKPSTKKAKRIVSFEPNSLAKTSLLPAVITEEANREEPESIECLHLLSAYERKDLLFFRHMLMHMSLVKDNKLFAETRHPTPLVLNGYTDVVLAFSWDSALNYQYYEDLYAGYPLVHNSPMLKEAHVGYYYPEFNAYEGAKQLLYAIHHYDEEMKENKKRNKKFLASLDPLNKKNIETYGKLLDDLIHKRNRLS